MMVVERQTVPLHLNHSAAVASVVPLQPLLCSSYFVVSLIVLVVMAAAEVVEAVVEPVVERLNLSLS